MFPLRDSQHPRKFPFINYLIITATVIVFFLQIFSSDFESFVYRYGFVPARFHFLNLNSYLFIFYSLFLHASWFHLLANIWFLYIFGDNVEDKLGHLGYLIFYLMAGLVAIFSQLIFNLKSNLPMIGASGAISGVIGAYFVLCKRAKVEALVPTFFGFYTIMKMPAWIFLGYWFFLQFFSGIGSLVTLSFQQGGVAWFAHIGGFLFGYLLGKKYKKIFQ